MNQPMPPIPGSAIPILNQTPMGSTGKTPGATAVKAWGVILIALGAIGLLGTAANAIMSLRAGMPFGYLGPPPPPEVQRVMEDAMNRILEDALSRWTFWAGVGLEAAVAVTSFVAGVALLRTRAWAWKAALARALVVILVLSPVSFVESTNAVESSTEMMAVTMDAMQKASGTTAPNSEQLLQSVREGTRIGMIVGFIVMSVLIVALNVILALTISTKKVRDFLADGPPPQIAIPGYNASMGMLAGAPPPGPPPGPPPDASTD